ncbi:MAG: hypothetical protein KDD60_07095 [Bdellovibrionales bacterium]|nr:hypothetical protein [Bdellovibrionales bacterium]
MQLDELINRIQTLVQLLSEWSFESALSDHPYADPLDNESFSVKEELRRLNALPLPNSTIKDLKKKTGTLLAQYPKLEGKPDDVYWCNKFVTDALTTLREIKL